MLSFMQFCIILYGVVGAGNLGGNRYPRWHIRRHVDGGRNGENVCGVGIYRVAFLGMAFGSLGLSLAL